MILGASFDSVDENHAFAEAQEFGYRLLSDIDRTVGESYGVTRSELEQYAAFARRWSFLIDPNGIVRAVYDVADVADHADRVLADLRTMQEST